MLSDVVIATRNLLQAGRRTAFLATALFLVTFMLVLMLALTQGVKDSLIRAATTVQAGQVNVGGFFKATPSDVATIISGVDDIKKIVGENTPGLVKLIDRVRGWGKLISDTGSVQTGLTGIDIADEGDLSSLLTPAEEREYKTDGRAVAVGDVRDLAKPHTAVIFASQAKRLGVGVGDALTIRTETLRGTTNTCEVTVAAVVRDLGLLSSWSVFVPKDTIRELYQLRPDTSGAVQIYLDDIERSESVMAHLREVFTQKGFKLRDHEAVPFFVKLQQVPGEDWTGQQLDLTTWSDEVNFLMWVLTALSSISAFLVTILTAIIAVGIMNAMWIAVRERTREIGTLRAIGMGRGRVLRLFMLEALVLGVCATTAGASTGALVSFLIDRAAITVRAEAMVVILMSNTLHLTATPAHVLLSIGAFTLVTTLSALWPAARAARITPIRAMQTAE